MFGMTEKEDIRWGTAQRFEFIEWRAYWVGRVNRGDLEKCFGVSTPQASIVLSDYQEAAKDNIRYDKTEKTYLPTDTFKPKFLRLSANQYLSQLDAILNGAIAPGDTWFGSAPPTSVVQTVLRTVDPSILHAILRAIERRLALEISYQSLTNTRDRSIVPHALAFDGFRWHVRALCVDRKEFRDFVLSRILSTAGSQLSNIDITCDVEWYSFTKLKIVAHPKLTAAQRSVIERDFGMIKGVRTIETRVALAYYAIKGLNLDLTDEMIPPERKQIFLTNLTEVENATQTAKQESKKRLALQMPVKS